jgi:LysR family nitrogen assimilation transcriptional regulator
LDLKQLSYFVHVAELSSFTRAAARLGVAQPALSRQVRQLEVELRQTLLTRNGRGASLTEAGRRLLEHARGILYQVERAREELDGMRGAPVGHAVIGVPPSVGRNMTGSLVSEFSNRFPKATLGIVEGLSTYILEWLAAGRIDVGVVYNPAPSPAIETVPLASEPLFLIGSTDRKRRAAQVGTPVPLQALSGFRLIVPSQPHAMRMFIETHLAHGGGKIDVAWEVDGIPAIVDLVARGYGHAVLPMNAIRNHPLRLQLLPRPIVKPKLAITLALVTSSQRPMTPLARQVVGLVKDLMASQVAPRNERDNPARG